MWAMFSGFHWFRSLRGVLLCLLVSTLLAPGTVSGQAPPAVETLVRNVLQRVVKTRSQQVLIVPLGSCLLDPQRCEQFDSRLRVELAKAVPGVHLLGTQDLAAALRARNLLQIDSYMLDAVEMLASDTGATILVTESLPWEARGRDLTVVVFDAVAHKELGKFSSKDFQLSPDPTGEPLVLQDPTNTAAIVISKGGRREYPVSRRPQCDACPSPKFTNEMRVNKIPWKGVLTVLATINDQGRPSQVQVLQTFDSTATIHTITTIQGWRFKPAIGADGQPFAVRTLIEVTYSTR